MPGNVSQVVPPFFSAVQLCSLPPLVEHPPSCTRTHHPPVFKLASIATGARRATPIVRFSGLELGGEHWVSQAADD